MANGENEAISNTNSAGARLAGRCSVEDHSNPSAPIISVLQESYKYAIPIDWIKSDGSCFKILIVQKT